MCLNKTGRIEMVNPNLSLLCLALSLAHSSSLGQPTSAKDWLEELLVAYHSYELPQPPMNAQLVRYRISNDPHEEKVHGRVWGLALLVKRGQQLRFFLGTEEWPA